MRASTAIFVAAIAATGANAIVVNNVFGHQLMRRAYPSCANSCIASPDYGSCQSTDLTCLCKSSVFLDTTTQCIYNECSSASDLKQAFDTAESACAAAGVTLTSTYTPTQSRSATSAGQSSSGAPASATSPAGSVTSASSASKKSGSSTASVTSTGSAASVSSTGSAANNTTAPASTGGSSSTPAPTTSTKSGAGLSSVVSSSSVFGFVGAALFAALAL